MAEAPSTSSPATPPDLSVDPRDFKAWCITMPTWQKALLGAAGVMLIAGGAMSFTQGPEGAMDPTAGTLVGGGQPPGGGTPGNPAATGLTGGIQLPGDPNPGTIPGGQPAPANQSPVDTPWSKALVTFGFSFFIGFAIGYAARAFMRVSLVFLGVFLVALFLLDYKGWVEIDWFAMEASFNSAISHLGDEFARFRSFITGSLPQAGMGGLGLWTGFRKH